MQKDVLKFEDFVNEELNYTDYDSGVCRLSDRWFYYNLDDDIIYGTDEKPVLDDNILFAFNPVSCTIIVDGEEKQYDVNDPLCLIHYDTVNNEVFFFIKEEKGYDPLEYLQLEFDFKGDDLTSVRSRHRLEYLFQQQDNDKLILIYGDQLIASNFDVIEEN